MRIGYFLATEEFTPAELPAQAEAAERAGFHGLWISDHYHPWNDAQGQSPFVWTVLGALAKTTELRVTTAVTCPTVRIHPAVVAQAAATTAVMFEGRPRDDRAASQQRSSLGPVDHPPCQEPTRDEVPPA